MKKVLKAIVTSPRVRKEFFLLARAVVFVVAAKYGLDLSV